MTARLLCATLALLAASATHAGVVIETVERDAKTGKTGDGARISVQGGVARFDQTLAAGGGDYVLFRDDVLYLVDTAKRRYTPLDRQTVGAMAGQMGAAMEQMKAELARLPPEQRQMMEQMMGGKLPGAKAPRAPLVARDLGRGETVDGRHCRLWELARARVVESQVCVVPFSALPGQEDLLGLMQRLNEFMQPLTEALEGFGAVAEDAETMSAVKGFPVLWRDFDGGKPTGQETVLKAWRAEAIAPALLQVPKGYRPSDPLAGRAD